QPATTWNVDRWMTSGRWYSGSVVSHHARRSFAQFDFLVHLLDLRGLFFQGCLQPHYGRLQLSHFLFLRLHLAVFFEELVEQHRVHRLIAYRVRLALVVASHQVWIHLFNLLGDQTELGNAIRIKLVVVAEGNRSEREDRFARLVHRLDRVFVTL